MNHSRMDGGLVRISLTCSALCLVALVAAGCSPRGSSTQEGTLGDSSPSASVRKSPAASDEGVVHTVTPADLAAVKSQDPIRSTHATLYVNGMGCPLCVTNVDKQLVRVKGVESVSVDLGAGTVDVGLTGKTKPSPAALAEAVDQAGLTLVKIRVNP